MKAMIASKRATTHQMSLKEMILRTSGTWASYPRFMSTPTRSSSVTTNIASIRVTRSMAKTSKPLTLEELSKLILH